MRRAAAVSVLVSAALFGLAGSTGAGAADSADRGSYHLGAVLVGGNEVPGPGDSGYGLADVRVKGKSVCWKITIAGVGDPTAAHIHAGPAGVSGPVVVPLAPWHRGCTDVAKRVARFILEHPDQFYVNVHNEAYGGGAVRGQLAP